MERAEAERIYVAGREVCVEFLLELSARYEREVARLEARVARLEEQGRSSSRTSKPPSQDPPKTRQQRRAEARAKAFLQKEAEPRRAGGQPGHQGAGRKLASEDQVDEIVDHSPEACQGCGHEFSEKERAASRRCGRRQVAELPAISVNPERASHAPAGLPALPARDERDAAGRACRLGLRAQAPGGPGDLDRA